LDNFGFARMYKLKSRKAITSGTLNTVPDESVFLHYLIKQLSENENQMPTNSLGNVCLRFIIILSILYWSKGSRDVDNN